MTVWATNERSGAATRADRRWLRQDPYREPAGGYDLEPPIETPEQQQARVWAIQTCDAFVTVWQDPVVTYTQAYCAALGHIHGRPLWRDN